MKPVLPATAPTVTRLLLGAACVAGLLLALHHFAVYLVPLTAACLLTVLVLPAVDALERLKVPRALAASVVALGSTLAITVVGFFGALVMLEIGQTVAEEQLLRRGLGPVGLQRLEDIGLPLDGRTESPEEARFLLDLTLRILGGAGGLALGLITHVLLLWELPDILARTDRVIRRSFGPLKVSTADRLEELGLELRTFLWIKCAISAMTAVCAAGVMFAVGLDHLLPFATLVFLLNFVPHIGSLIAAVVPVGVAAATLGLSEAAVVAGGLAIANVVLGNLVEPWWMGGRLSLSPTVVFVGVILWGAVWGIPGALLSVPLTHLFVGMLEIRDDTRWLAEMLRPHGGTKWSAEETKTHLRPLAPRVAPGSARTDDGDPPPSRRRAAPEPTGTLRGL